MDFTLSGIYGPYGVNLRGRLYAPDGSTVADLALTESPAGTYGGTVALSPAPAQSTSSGDDYEYEVRQVSTQSGAAFDASTTTIISRGFYGYVIGGAWADGVTVPLPTSADYTTASGPTYDSRGVLAGGVVVTFRQVELPTGAASGCYDSTPFDVTSGVNAILSVELLRNTRYYWKRGSRDGYFRTGAAPTYSLPALLGRPA